MFARQVFGPLSTAGLAKAFKIGWESAPAVVWSSLTQDRGHGILIMRRCAHVGVPLFKHVRCMVHQSRLRLGQVVSFVWVATEIEEYDIGEAVVSVMIGSHTQVFALITSETN